MKTKNIGKMLLAIAICESAGAIGSLFTTPAIPTWFSGINKPTFSPPNWLFAPVWTILFALMGIAVYLVYREGRSKKTTRIALLIFAVQLLLNILWSVLFFGMHNPGLALIEIICLWIAILFTIISFFRISKPAAILLIPYILWVSFASVLNFSIWRLNFQLMSPTVCTMEAKLCPDGSFVGRTGPKCEFAPCPAIDVTKTWTTFADAQRGILFKYPQDWGTTYIHPVDWPPQVEIMSAPFACTEGGTEIARAGITAKTLINGTEYCVTKESEGAAGSIYTNYAYAFAKDNKTIIFTFTGRAVQCDNYDDPQKTACKNERASFVLDNLVDPIAKSFQLSS